MNRSRRLPVLALAAATLSAGCVTEDVITIAVANVHVTAQKTSVEVGETVQLQARPLDDHGTELTGRTIEWSSSNPSAASVDAAGRVRGLAPGTVSITAMVEGRSGSATLTVTPAAVASVTITPTPVNIDYGQTTRLTATVRDARGEVLTGRTVTWSSGNTAIATVNAQGDIFGAGVGTTTVTATSESVGGSATVNVNPIPPTATTQPATNIGPGTARMNGIVTPNGSPPTVWFEFGLSSNPASFTRTGTGTGSLEEESWFSILSGLAGSTRYYYRIVAENAGGTTAGAVLDFTTAPPQAPTATTQAATNVRASRAVLNGEVVPNGAPAATRFEIATAPSMAGAAQLCIESPQLLVRSYECDEIDLFGNTTYYFRIRAVNSVGVATGNVRNFTTAPPEPPLVSTDSVKAASATSAQLFGSAYPNGAPLTLWIDVALNSNMSGATRFCQLNWDEPTGAIFGCTVGGLAAGTTYYFRAGAENSAGTTLGQVRSFTFTGSAPPGAAAAPASGVTRVSPPRAQASDGGAAPPPETVPVRRKRR